LERLPPHFKQQYETALTTQGSFGQPMRDTDPYAAECAAHYFGLIEMVDHHAGRILDALERNGLAENTLVIFTADHGEALGDHWMWGKGPYHFDGVIRVPLIVRWPGGGSGEHGGVVSLLDLAPTILEATGAEMPPWPGPATPAVAEAPGAPSPLAGRSLLGVLRGAAADGAALVEEDEDYLGCRLRTLVTQRYRLTAYSGQPYGELFDLQEDPDEFHNLWDDPGRAALKQALLVRLLEKTMETELPLPRQSSRS
jgi:arylsulfatase